MAQPPPPVDTAEDLALRGLQLEELEDHGLVGSGSSGLVRRVRHSPTGRDLVLKVRPCSPVTPPPPPSSSYPSQLGL